MPGPSEHEGEPATTAPSLGPPDWALAAASELGAELLVASPAGVVADVGGSPELWTAPDPEATGDAPGTPPRPRRQAFADLGEALHALDHDGDTRQLPDARALVDFGRLAAELDALDDVDVQVLIWAHSEGATARVRSRDVRRWAVVELTDERPRYGGYIWPWLIQDGRTLLRLGPLWYQARPAGQGVRRLSTTGQGPDAFRRAVEEFGGFDWDDDGVPIPGVAGELDAVWHGGEVFVLSEHGGTVPLVPAADVPAVDDVVPERITWGERGHRFVALRGHVFDDDTAWHAVGTDAAGLEVAEPPMGVPADVLADDHLPAAILLTATSDVAEPLWRALSRRLVVAAWRAPSVWDGRDGRPLRHPPVVAVTADGHRLYGVRAAHPRHAAEVADAFGVHWIAWDVDPGRLGLAPRAEGSAGAGGHLVVVRTGAILASAPAGPVAAQVPIEGDALWDDERLAAGQPFPRLRNRVSFVVAEVRAAIAEERRLSEAPPTSR